VIQYLVDKGAKLDIKDVEGKTALDVALNGIFRGDSIGTPPVLLFKFPDHTAALMKKLTVASRNIVYNGSQTTKSEEVIK
jgi:hypothetical protein